MDIHQQSLSLPKFPLSAFDLSYTLKTCLQGGQMGCHYVEEAIPGDIAHVKTDIFMRLDPLTFPVMHRIKIRQNFFFVPTRLVLGDRAQEEFFSCKDMMAKLPSYYCPMSTAPNFFGKNSLFDMMECEPIITAGPSSVNALIRNPLPFLMFQLIYKDWYADEILDSSDISGIESMIDTYQNTPFGSSIGVSASNNPFQRRNVSYSKDRFTSAQPDAQRVGEVYLMNPLEYQGVTSGVTTKPTVTNSSGGYLNLNNQPFQAGEQVRSTLTIDELWDEMVVQRFLNSMNEFGNERYTEILAGQFGVLSADARLQRPEWLGGNQMYVNISEVLQTSESSLNNPLGSLAGRGIVSGRGYDIAFKVPEHGFIIGVLSIVPDNGYASGSPRWLYKSTPLDFAFPRFNNLGEQAVLNGELSSDHTDPATGTTYDMDEFGYQPQFDEYRSHPSRATGDFRDSNFIAWHLDRKFVSPPSLNSNFIEVSSTDMNRIFNDTDTNAYHFRVLSFHKAMYVRPISRHPIPGKL